jgi:hypothetical protein
MRTLSDQFIDAYAEFYSPSEHLAGDEQFRYLQTFLEKIFFTSKKNNTTIW